MSTNNHSLVIGPYGFGRNHIREYLENKFKTISLLSKNQSKCSEKKNSLNINESDKNKIVCIKYNSLKKISKIKFVSICSPNISHLFFLNNRYIKKKKILCEKPLIWEQNTNLKQLHRMSDKILIKSNGNTLFNDFSRYFSTQLKKKEKFSKINKIEVSYTVKSKSEKNLSVDLLVHLIAIIQGLIDISSEIKIIKFQKKSNFHYYEFLINNTKIIFVLKNKNLNQSKLKIKINNNLFIRKNIFKNNKLQIFFRKKNKEIKIKNPFKIGFKYFLKRTKLQRKRYLVKQIQILNVFFRLVSL